MELILESNRDELLKPYYNLLISNGRNMSFGQFKSMLLEYFTQNGKMRNLSLASNYYLAGVARYYFNGDLTLNKDLSLVCYDFTPNSVRTAQANNGVVIPPNKDDTWNEDVCKKLNALIKILRDSYINSIGTKYEVEENFGEIPLKKLLSMYNAKIKRELGFEERGFDLVDNYSPEAGNGYTFEIIYDYKDCKKYNEATSPGAWCITYGEGHYNYYINNLNIHYVIFRRNGYETVEREPNKNMWKPPVRKFPKPQDEYGNSLIAFLQSNESWKPVYITSRWNHGAGDCGDVEADYAYTLEEFEKITGVSDDDLKRIFKIWKQNATEYESKQDKNKAEKEFLLRLKEAQIRINGGENMFNLFDIHDFVVGDMERIKKSVVIASFKGDMNYFIIDKGKIVFETIRNISGKRVKEVFDATAFHEAPKTPNVIHIYFDRYVMVYDYRRHSILNIDGIYKFKAVTPIGDKRDNDCEYLFYEAKTSNTNIALIDLNTGIPLKLPNGQCWFNKLVTSSMYSDRLSKGNMVNGFFIGDDSEALLEIVYDMSSGEKYFYNCVFRKFVDLPEFNGDERYLPDIPDGNQSQSFSPILVSKFEGGALGTNKFYVIKYCPKSWSNSRYNYYCTPFQLFRINGEKISIGGTDFFNTVKYLGNSYFAVIRYDDDRTVTNEYGDPKEYIIFNADKGTYHQLNGKNISFNSVKFSGNEFIHADKSRAVYFIVKLDRNMRADSDVYLFDKEVGKFVVNPYNYPTHEIFYSFDQGRTDGSALIFNFQKCSLDFNHWEKDLFVVNLVEQITYKFSVDPFKLAWNEMPIEAEGRYEIRPIQYFN
jgi:hypothetical protein